MQAGDPLTKDASQKHLWGTGGPGYTIQAELGLPHERGSIAMARLGDAVNPNKASSGSQFYIALARLPKLDREYTVFGKVIAGLDILDQIAKSSTDTNNNPSERVEIVAASVTGGVKPTIATATAKAPVPAKVPSPADTPPATKPKAAKKSMAADEKKEAATLQAAAAPKLKKESWFKRTFGKKKKAREVAVAEEPKPAATVASNNSEPTYRNESQADSRSVAHPQVSTSDGNDADSLASEMRTPAPQGDVVPGEYKERGVIGRFLYRYW